MLLALVLTVAAIALGRVLDILGLALFDIAPYAVAVLCVALATRHMRWAGAGAVLVGGPVLVSRCVLAPVTLSALTPLVAGGAAAVFLLVNVRRLRFRDGSGWFLLVVLGLALLLVLPGIVGADQTSLLKGAGVGVMWVLAAALAVHLVTAERTLLVTGFVWAMLGEAVVAMSESFLRLQVVRLYLVAGVGGSPYQVWPNRLLGDWTNRSFGTIGHPIPLSLLLLLALIAILGTFRRERWPLRVLAALVLLGGIASTGARSSIPVLLVAVIVLLASALRRVRAHRRVAITAAVLAVLILGAGVGTLLIRAISSSDYSIVHRSGMVESAAGLFAQPLDRVLFGFGYNAPVRLHDLGIIGTDNLNVVDNTLVTQTATAGVIGLFALFLLIAVAFSRGGRIARAAIGACVASMFFFDLQSWHLIMLVVWFLLATSIVNRAADRSPSVHRRTGIKTRSSAMSSVPPTVSDPRRG